MVTGHRLHASGFRLQTSERGQGEVMKATSTFAWPKKTSAGDIREKQKL
jgi:hypothetical protein